MPQKAASSSLAESLIVQTMLVIVVACAVYLPFLGSKPLDMAEGHRVVPAWTMLETGEWWRMRMFDLTYIRKPPGMSWAIAASSSVLGMNEFAARLPSALAAVLMSVTALWYARRWFGRSWALAGGLAQALMPVMWAMGRSAEIEMVLLLGTQWMCLGLIDVLRPLTLKEADERLGAESRTRWLSMLVAAAGIIIAVLAKGPAAAPAPGGVLVGACVVMRSWRPLTMVRVWLALGIAAAVLVPVGMKFLDVNADVDAVREDVAAKFLGKRDHLVDVLLLAPVSFASMLPATLAIVPALWRAKPDAPAALSRDRDVARMLAWAWIVCVAIIVLIGMDNARYAIVAAALLGPLAAWTVRKWAESESRLPVGVRILCVLLMTSGVATAIMQARPTKDQFAGPAAAASIAKMAREAAPGGAEIWANNAIEARPDVAWQAQRLATGPGSAFKVKWKQKAIKNAELPPTGTLMLLRLDAGNDESTRYSAAVADERLKKLGEAKVRSYVFGVYARIAD
jgi:hypothetical protein